ncbi:MAG: hypothetical protein QOC54_634, partial [Baekduia sp.]|nr:hypothetical protein [Baekduia sp.]
IEQWEFDVLAALRRAGTPYELSPGRLLRETLVTSGTMTNRVDRLAARGLVERRPAPHDRRIRHLVLTDEGRALRDRVAQLLEAPPEGFAALSRAEAQLLRDLLVKVAAAGSPRRA